MKRVIGIGGIFFKCNHPEGLRAWYQQHLGLQTDSYGTSFEFRKSEPPYTKAFLQWSPFPQDTQYFEPSEKAFMVNYRVENLEALAIQLKAEGVQILDEIETFEYGKFLHIMDPEGNKIELWEPVDAVYDAMIEARTV
jgi:predicted enzyme related to lactoylglutathione lyase